MSQEIVLLSISEWLSSVLKVGCSRTTATAGAGIASSGESSNEA